MPLRLFKPQGPSPAKPELRSSNDAGSGTVAPQLGFDFADPRKDLSETQPEQSLPYLTCTANWARLAEDPSKLKIKGLEIPPVSPLPTLL